LRDGPFVHPSNGLPHQRLSLQPERVTELALLAEVR
jgi:hypothetical protein